MALRAIRGLLLPVSAALLVACVSQPISYPPGEPCRAAAFTVTDDFDGARRGDCTVLGDDHVELVIRPEDEGKVNNSAWFAFKLEPASATTARITLRYEGGNHRYFPKISGDGASWSRLDESAVTASEDRTSAEFVVPLDSSAAWVSAQELVMPEHYDAWNKRMSKATGIPLRRLGESREGLPIHVLDSNAEANEVLLMVGRQHPPEVSGAFAFFAFTETVFGDSALAMEFRERFRVIAIPLMNPDGVVAGNWRHNMGHLDINRDWGSFTQPETKLVGDLLDELDAGGYLLRMFVDFHSTDKNVFYTQQEPTSPPGFTRTWLENAAPLIDNYPFYNGEGPVKNPAIAKNYIYTRYGIPAVTFEAGDETDRAAVRSAARIFAEELMRLMLVQEY